MAHHQSATLTTPPLECAVLDDAVAAIGALHDAAERSSLAQLLLSKRCFFTAMRCLLTAPTQLLALLADVRAACEGASASGEPGDAASAPVPPRGGWHEADRQSLCAHHAALPAVRAYTAVAPHLDACGVWGVQARVTLESQLLARIVSDFGSQLVPLAGPCGHAVSPPAVWLDAHQALRSAKAAFDADAAAERRSALAKQELASQSPRQRANSPSKGPRTPSGTLTATIASAVVRPPLPPVGSRPAALPQRIAIQRAAREAAEQAAAAAAVVAALERQKAALEAKLAAEKARAERGAAALAQAQAEKNALAERLRRVASVNDATTGTVANEQADADSGADGDVAAEQRVTVSRGFSPQHGAMVDTKPTPEEVREYAAWLGMDPITDSDLFYIAEWALTAPLPIGWSAHQDDDGNEYYFNDKLGESTYEHPLDGQYRKYWRTVREQKNAAERDNLQTHVTDRVGFNDAEQDTQADTG